MTVSSAIWITTSVTWRTRTHCCHSWRSHSKQMRWILKLFKSFAGIFSARRIYNCVIAKWFVVYPSEFSMLSENLRQKICLGSYRYFFWFYIAVIFTFIVYDTILTDRPKLSMMAWKQWCVKSTKWMAWMPIFDWAMKNWSHLTK